MKSRKCTQDYRLNAPEGGWGYLVCIGMALPFICAFSAIPCFGLIYKDFLERLNEGGSAVSVIISCHFSAMSFCGLLSSTLFSRYSMRSVGLAGGFMYCAGSVVQVFVQSTTQLFAAFSLLQGAAVGLVIPTAYTTFNHYFVERRVFMTGVAQSLIGLGTVLYPILTQKLLEVYGFRGCLAILAAISSHMIFGMLVLHPVEWHMRNIPIPKELCHTGKSDLLQLESLVKNIPAPEHSNTSLNTFPKSKLIGVKISKQPPTIGSTGNWMGPVILSEAFINGSKFTNKWKYHPDIFDLKLVRDSIYLNIALGVSFAFYADIAFLALLPFYLLDLGLSEVQTANIIAMGAAANIFSRLVLAVSSTFASFPARYVYLAGVLFSIVARTAFLSVFDFRGIAIMTIIIGFFKTWLHVPLPLVFSEYLPKERFPSGYGLFIFLHGHIMFVVGPIVGYVRDVTRSHEASFHCLNLFLAACAVPWLIEILFVKCRNRRRRRCELEAGPAEIQVL